MLFAHDWERMLAGHHEAAQVDGADVVEGFLGDFEWRLVAAPETDTYVVVQDVDAAPTLDRIVDHGV